VAGVGGCLISPMTWKFHNSHLKSSNIQAIADLSNLFIQSSSNE